MQRVTPVSTELPYVRCSFQREFFSHSTLHAQQPRRLGTCRNTNAAKISFGSATSLEHYHTIGGRDQKVTIDNRGHRVLEVADP